jgi:tetratricopeptide (TPR) repeat protein
MPYLSYKAKLSARKHFVGELADPSKNTNLRDDRSQNQSAKGLIWHLERFNVIRGTVTSTVTGAATGLLLLVVLIIVYQEYKRDYVVIDSFSMHPDLEKKGYTSQLIASWLSDEINRLRRGAKMGMTTSPKGSQYIPYFSPTLPDVQLPEAHVSLKSITLYLREIFGKNPAHISGDMSIKGEEMHLRVRVNNNSDLVESNTQINSGKESEIDSLLEKGAKFILSETDPFTLASVFYDNGQRSESLELVRKAIDSHRLDDAYHEKYDYYALVLNGIILNDNGEMDEAIAKFRDAISKYPKRSSAYIAWGFVLENRKRYDEALEKYRIARSFNDRGAAVALNNQGSVLLSQNRFEEAITKFRDAIGLDSKLALAYKNWGYALHQQGLDNEAVNKFQTALTLDPELVDTYINWSMMLSDQNDNKGALDKILQAIKVKPQYGQCYGAWGYILENMKDYNQAIAMYRKATELNANNDYIYNNWGLALEALGNYVEATTQYQKAIDLNSGYADAYRNLGDVLQKRKHYNEAIDMYQKAIEIDRTSAPAYKGLASVLRTQGDVKGASAQYQSAIDADPHDFAAYIDWGDMLMEQRDYDEAIAKYRKVVELDPNNVLAYNSVGNALTQKKDYAAAIASFQKVLQLNTDSQQSRYASDCIAGLQRKSSSGRKTVHTLPSKSSNTDRFEQKPLNEPRKPQ